MIRILANDGIEQDGQTLLEEANFVVETEKIPQEELPSKLPQYDVIIVRSATKVRKELIDQCPNLKVIARGGVGLDNIDVDYAQSKGIKVFNTPAASSKSVAELAFAHIFALARGLHLSNRELPKGVDFAKLKKQFSSGFELRGRTLGILGLGRIGQESARIALALGMDVIPVDIMIEEADISGYILKNTGKQELIEAIEKIAGGGIYFSDEVINELQRASDKKKNKDKAHLTAREIEIIRLIEKEYNNKEIAEELFISERTVETHRKNIFRKTGTSSVIGLIKYAYEYKLI